MRTPIDSLAAGAGATKALLDSGVDFEMADLYTITLNGGGVVRWSGADVPITFQGVSWGSPLTWGMGPAIDRGKISHKTGLEATTLDLDIMATPADLINGVPLLPFIAGGGFDAASIVMYRAVIAAWGDEPTGLVIDFAGRITEIREMGRSEATVRGSSWTVLCDVNMGPDFYQSPCLNTVGDANCTVNLNAFRATGTVGSGGLSVNGFNSNLTAADDYYTQGKIVWLTGANAGTSRAVKKFSHTSGAFQIALPMAEVPVAGDTFYAFAGCDQTKTTCANRFSNLINFRGQPFIPPSIVGSPL